MSLTESPLLYLFHEVSNLPMEQSLLEGRFGFPVIEIEPHLPHHRHGVVKYDAVNVILSLNLSGPGKFERGTSDGLVTMIRGSACWPRESLINHPAIASSDGLEIFTDFHGHHFAFPAARNEQVKPSLPTAVEELRLTVEDQASSVAFYRDTLGLKVLDEQHNVTRFRAGRVALSVTQARVAPDGRLPRKNTYLIVFYTNPIHEAFASLLRRGVPFKTPRPAESEIGYTARFEDPSGHTFCLYEPSAESLTWGSGAKVLELSAGAGASRAQALN